MAHIIRNPGTGLYLRAAEELFRKIPKYGIGNQRRQQQKRRGCNGPHFKSTPEIDTSEGYDPILCIRNICDPVSAASGDFTRSKSPRATGVKT